MIQVLPAVDRKNFYLIVRPAAAAILLNLQIGSLAYKRNCKAQTDHNGSLSHTVLATVLQTQG
jgi:hypothetical protein